MISGAHIILYSADAEADRTFTRDVLAFPWVDAGAGWLIFNLPPAEVAVHPTEGPAKREFFLMCDDLEEMMLALAAKGVSISRQPSDEGWECWHPSTFQAALSCSSISHSIQPPITCTCHNRRRVSSIRHRLDGDRDQRLHEAS